MAKTHSRSPSAEPETGAPKRLKIGHQSYAASASAAVPSPPVPGPATPRDVISCFAPDLFDADNVGRLAASYSTNEPFKHALIEKLFRDDLLQKVKDECLSELHFTEKETDIYKVSLSHLPPSPPPPPSSS
jgi:prolyl 3-hydroxylase /prolyl 3,4-dihydroxylase